MKLITELIDYQDLEIIKEVNEEKKFKGYKIQGPYLQAEIVNKNNRRYSKQLVEREVSKLNKTKIKENRAYGETDHPPTPTVSLKNASHLIESLVMDGNNAIGCSKVLDTPMGRIITTILDASGTIMMSSRGLGTLKGQDVQKDYSLITVDAVSDGSGPDTFVEGILENKEYIIGDDGNIVEVAIENMKKKVNKKYNSHIAFLYLKEFLDEIRKK